MLKLVIMDAQVGYEQVKYLNVNNIKWTDPEAEKDFKLGMEMHSIVNGKRVNFDGFNELYYMNKRKLLSYRTIYIRLS